MLALLCTAHGFDVGGPSPTIAGTRSLSTSEGKLRGASVDHRDKTTTGVTWWNRVEANKTWSFSSVDAMLGYTDCTSQTPPIGGPKAEQQWWLDKAGHHKLGRPVASDLGGPLFSPKVPNFGVCVVPKNGCTYWKALYMRIGGNPRWNSTEIMDMHEPTVNKLNFDASVLRKPWALVIMTVRNPITRTLSAWLDKREDPAYLQWFRDRPGTTESFATFVRTIAPPVRAHHADVHWSQQNDICFLNSGAEYDMYLKVECRTLWAPSLFEFKNMQRWTDSGWGPDGEDPFVRDDRSKLQHANSVQEAPPTQTKASRARKHSTGASGMDELCKYYTTETFNLVRSLYQKDIVRFAYQEDVRRIARACGFEA